MCPQEIFEGRNFQIKIIFFPSVCDFELMIFRILAKNVASVTKAAFYLSRLTFWKKNFFGEKEFNTFGFSGKKSQNFGLRVSRKKSWGNKFCIKKVIQTFFWIWERKIQTLTRKFSAELSEQHSTYPEVEIQEKNFWKYKVLRRSRTPSRCSRTFSE